MHHHDVYMVATGTIERVRARCSREKSARLEHKLLNTADEQ